MAFSVDLTTNQGAALDYQGKGRLFVLRQRVDFTVVANNLAQNEVMAIALIPANTWVLASYMKVITADTLVSDVDLGVCTTAAVEVDYDGWIDGGTIAAAGWVTTTLGVLNFLVNSTGVGYLSTSNAVLSLQNKDAQTIDDAVIDFYTVCADFSLFG